MTEGFLQLNDQEFILTEDEPGFFQLLVVSKKKNVVALDLSVEDLKELRLWLSL